MFAVISSHLRKLVQDRLLAPAIRFSIALSYCGCQLFTRCQFNDSPHLRSRHACMSGSILDEATTHCSVAKMVRQCAVDDNYFSLSGTLIVTDHGHEVLGVEIPFGSAEACLPNPHIFGSSSL